MKDTHTNFLMLYDLDVRDRKLIEGIATNLRNRGFTVRVEQLASEKDALQEALFDVVVINKPHFYFPWRLKAKLKGVKFVVLDTEGVLPGRNRQSCLLEPDGYLHWYRHQAERYSFKKTQVATIGYPRSHLITRRQKIVARTITVATNFSVLGYSVSELRKKKSDRTLKLKNDWSLLEYRRYQEKCFALLVDLAASNPDWKFVIKPHPNDATSTWRSFRERRLTNCEFFDHSKPIEDLFERDPVYHLCFDGCTTILDAYIAGIKVVTLSRFAPFHSSLLQNLEIENISSPDFSFDSIQQVVNEKTASAAEFIEETRRDSVRLAADLMVKVFESKTVRRLRDMPTWKHFVYWASFVRNKPASTGRVKMSKS